MLTEKELNQCRADYRVWLIATYGAKAINVDLWHVYKAAWIKGKEHG